MRHQYDLAQIAREIPVAFVRNHLALRRSLSDRHRAEDERLAGGWKDADRASVGAMRLEAASGDARGWGISLPSLGEFWGIVTHPAASGRPSKPAEAAGFLRALVATGGMQVWGPGPGFPDRLLQLAIDLDVSGVRVFDLQIALIAFESGATELWTHDRSFLRIAGLRVSHPLV
jgi:predicted nucleic acid-binding protein